jgi:hypothetical protein
MAGVITRRTYSATRNKTAARIEVIIGSEATAISFKEHYSPRLHHLRSYPRQHRDGYVSVLPPSPQPMVDFCLLGSGWNVIKGFVFTGIYKDDLCY